MKRQYNQAKEWVQDRSPSELVMLILGPLLLLSIIGFVVYRAFGGSSRATSTRASSRRSPTVRARSRSRGRASANGNARRRNGARSVATSTA